MTVFVSWYRSLICLYLLWWLIFFLNLSLHFKLLLIFFPSLYIVHIFHFLFFCSSKVTCIIIFILFDPTFKIQTLLILDSFTVCLTFGNFIRMCLNADSFHSFYLLLVGAFLLNCFAAFRFTLVFFSFFFLLIFFHLTMLLYEFKEIFFFSTDTSNY